MGRLLILPGLLLIGWWLTYRLRRLPPPRRRQLVRQGAIWGGVALLILAAASGRLSPILAALGAGLGALLAVLQRASVLLNLLASLRRLLDSLGLGAPFASRGTDQTGGSRSAGASQLTEAEALAILGLEPGADADAIRAAHRRLIQRLHPDRGGSDYLAARINAARRRLLGE